MQSSGVAEGALTVYVNRALSVTADAAHHVIATPATAVIEGAKSATVFVATHLVVGTIKLGCSAGWWLMTSAAAAVGAGASLAYCSFFGSSEPKCAPISKTSADSLFQENNMTPRSVDMDTTSPTQKKDAACAPKLSVLELD